MLHVLHGECNPRACLKSLFLICLAPSQKHLFQEANAQPVGLKCLSNGHAELYHNQLAPGMAWHGLSYAPSHEDACVSVSVKPLSSLIPLASNDGCRTQYPINTQQQLISVLANLSSQGNTTLPLLLEANAFISDVLALSFAGSIDPVAILDTAAAVAASPAASTGFGLYLLVQPVVEALQQLIFFAQVCHSMHKCQEAKGCSCNQSNHCICLSNASAAVKLCMAAIYDPFITRARACCHFQLNNDSGSLHHSTLVADVAAAVAACPAASTAFGMYLLVLPVAEALQQLMIFAEVLSSLQLLITQLFATCQLLS